VTTEGARFYLGSVIGTLFGAHPRDVSLLQTLFYVRSAGGTLEVLTGIRGAAQERRFVGGSQQIAKRIARGLGRSVHLRSPVRRSSDAATASWLPPTAACSALGA
jgi:monoamine oxidase